MGKLRTVLASLLISASSIAGCYSDAPKNAERNELVQPPSRRSSDDKGALEAKLKKLDVFYISESDASSLVDLTRSALNERKGVLQKLDEIVEDSRGKKEVIIKISTTYCSPCRASHKKFVEFAKEHSKVKAVHMVVDADIVDAESLFGLRLAYDFDGGVPRYLIIDTEGHQIGKEPGYSLEEAVKRLENLPKQEYGSDGEHIRTLALAKKFVRAHPVPVYAKQVTVIDDNHIITDNYELLEFLGEQTGEKVSWDERLEESARKSYTGLDFSEMNANEILAEMLHRLDQRDYFPEGNPIDFRGCLEEYKKTLPPDGNKYFVREATRVRFKPEEEPRIIYDTNDFFNLVHEKTGLEIHASDDTHYSPVIFTTNGGSLTEVLSNMFIQNEDCFKTTMFELGKNQNKLLVIE
jgi:thiol-disulfide isomerase/thioredoxin